MQRRIGHMRLLCLCLLSTRLAVADSALPAAAAPDPTALLAPWAKCKALAEHIPFHADDFSPRMTVKPHPNGVEVWLASEGSGRDAIGTYHHVWLRTGRCTARGYELNGPKEWIDWQLTPVGWGAAPPKLAELPSLDGAVGVRRVDGELAAARAITSLWNDPPTIPLQPEYPGRPHGSPKSLWSATALKAVGTPLTVLDEPEKEYAGPGPVALEIGRVREPNLIELTARFEIWQLRFRARNGGGLLAIYDKERDRHRWVWATHGDWSRGHSMQELGTDAFQVVARDDERLVVWNTFDHTNQLISIDMISGKVRIIPGLEDREYRRAPTGVAVVKVDNDETEHAERIIPISELY